MARGHRSIGRSRLGHWVAHRPRREGAGMSSEQAVAEAPHRRSAAGAIGRTTDCRHRPSEPTWDGLAQGRPRAVTMGAPLPEMWNPENGSAQRLEVP